jgi:hypothetical protein
MNSETKNNLTRPDVLSSFLLAEFVTLTRTCAPVCWPVLCEYQQERIVVSTPYISARICRRARLACSGARPGNP